MYHVTHDDGIPYYNSQSYHEGRRSTPSYALVPHNSSNNRRLQYATTHYRTEPRYRSETRYHSGTTRYHSEPPIYRDSRIDTYQGQRYVVPLDSSTLTQYRTSHHDQWVPTRYGQTSRGYKYRKRVVERPIPVCACIIM